MIGAEGYSELEEKESTLFGIDMESSDSLHASIGHSTAEGSSEAYRRADRGPLAESEGEDKEPEMWKAQKIDTAFGITDDVVNLTNGKTYYYFKLPHKVVIR